MGIVANSALGFALPQGSRTADRYQGSSAAVTHPASQSVRAVSHFRPKNCESERDPADHLSPPERDWVYARRASAPATANGDSAISKSMSANGLTGWWSAWATMARLAG